MGRTPLRPTFLPSFTGVLRRQYGQRPMNGVPLSARHTTGVVVLTSALLEVLEPKLSETEDAIIAARIAHIWPATNKKAEVRRLFEIKNRKTATVAVERADALIAALLDDAPLVLQTLEHWPRTRTAAMEMVDAEAWVAGVELTKEQGRKLTEDLHRLGQAVIATERRRNPVVQAGRDEMNAARRKRTARRRAERELVAA